MATLLDRLAQVAYEAYRGALPTHVLPWEDITKQERQAWKTAVSAVAGEAGGTLREPPPGKSLVIQMGGQRHTFGHDFTVGREGSLIIDDRPIEVTGKAWMDREWSSQPLASDRGGRVPRNRIV